ncbi:MAG TPA: rhamnogalacturonan acetylesterase [Rariglobus sp.]
MKPLLVLFFLTALSGLAQEDDRPVVKDSDVAVENVGKPSLPTLWIVGDSTVKNSGASRGWGQDLPLFFDLTKINVINCAIGGRSSRSFIREGRWQKVLDQLKPGDFVLVQFGHNDSGKIDDPTRYRASLPGIGEETQEITRDDGTRETVHTYGWYLRHYARTAKAKGAARVVLCSPIPHKQYDASGKFVPNGQRWQDYVSTCAREEKVDYVDLTGLVTRVYLTLDASVIDGYFSDVRTHTTPAGALVNATALIGGLKALPGSPFAPFLNAKGRQADGSGL